MNTMNSTRLEAINPLRINKSSHVSARVLNLLTTHRCKHTHSLKADFLHIFPSNYDDVSPLSPSKRRLVFSYWQWFTVYISWCWCSSFSKVLVKYMRISCFLFSKNEQFFSQNLYECFWQHQLFIWVLFGFQTSSMPFITVLRHFQLTVESFKNLNGFFDKMVDKKCTVPYFQAYY